MMYILRNSLELFQDEKNPNILHANNLITCLVSLGLIMVCIPLIGVYIPLWRPYQMKQIKGLFISVNLKLMVSNF